MNGYMVPAQAYGYTPQARRMASRLMTPAQPQGRGFWLGVGDWLNKHSWVLPAIDLGTMALWAIPGIGWTAKGGITAATMGLRGLAEVAKNTPAQPQVGAGGQPYTNVAQPRPAVGPQVPQPYPVPAFMSGSWYGAGEPWQASQPVFGGPVNPWAYQGPQWSPVLWM